jgi:predicted O-methyltransferase YrrM
MFFVPADPKFGNNSQYVYMADIEYRYTPELAAYIREHSLREHDVLRRLREETALHPRADMQISPELGQFLSFLVRAIGARRCLEIGVFTGYSSTVVALALPANGRLVACDVNEETSAVARRYWGEAGVSGKIDLHLGPALETLDSLIAQGFAGTFDFAFIDADKPSYRQYWDRTLTLIRTGGIIAVDNVLWSGRVADPAVQDDTTRLMREFNAAAARDTRVHISMLPIRDGLTLACKL